MALLQLDMLGYVDTGAQGPVLVIGGGVPREWFSQSMSVEKLRVGLWVVSWQWNGNALWASIQGPGRVPVRLGAGFPENATMNLTFLP
jgi:hypothetical protein